MSATKKCLGTFVRKHLEGRELLEKQCAGLRLNGGERDARLDPTDNVDPFNFRIVQVGNAKDHGHRLDRQIELRWVAGKPIAEVTLRRDAENSDWLSIDQESAADNAGIGAVVMSPRVVAHDGGKGGALSVVRVGEEVPSGGLKSKGPEVVARDKFAHHRFRDGLRGYATRRQGAIIESGFHRCQFVKLRQVLFEQEIRLGRKQRVVAIVVVARVDAEK